MKPHRRIWRYLVGEPLPTSAFEEERLTNAAALAVLSSDALSSVAYATKEILIVLILARTFAFACYDFIAFRYLKYPLSAECRHGKYHQSES